MILLQIFPNIKKLSDCFFLQLNNFKAYYKITLLLLSFVQKISLYYTMFKIVFSLTYLYEFNLVVRFSLFFICACLWMLVYLQLTHGDCK